MPRQESRDVEVNLMPVLREGKAIGICCGDAGKYLGLDFSQLAPRPK